METRQLNMGMEACIVTHRDSEDPGKGCMAIAKAHGVLQTTVRDFQKKVQEPDIVITLKGRARKSKKEHKLFQDVHNSRRLMSKAKVSSIKSQG